MGMETTHTHIPIPSSPSAPSPAHPLTSSPPPALFHPTEEAADDILAAYVDPDQTLKEIARRFKVSIRALASWLNHPDTLQHIHDLQEATNRRARFIAAANQRLALNLLIAIIEGHLDAEANIPVNTQSLKAVAQRDRARATARLAASQLIRLSGSGGPSGPGVSPGRSARGSHDPGTHPRRTPPAPSPTHPIPSSPPRAPNIATHNIETPPPSLSPIPQPTTQRATDRQAASATQSALHAPPPNAALHHASSTNESG